MIWVDREVKKIKERRRSLEWVDDMKTPSGRIHVGALRGIVIHDMIHKALQQEKIKTRFTYVFEDHDPMDAIPSYLDFRKWEQYAGMQLYTIPSPVSGYKSYAEYYAFEFQKVFESINCHPHIIWGSELYLSGKMNGVIREMLDHADTIRDIYKRIARAEKSSDWHPFQAVCQKCQKVGTTHVYDWDGKMVSYRCMPQMVAWAKGCSHEGKISPFNGNGKLAWKVEWGAKWKVIGITIEGAGKDHMSAGGSYDIASAICHEVLDYPVPYSLPYEWFIVGGRKMSSSKGVGVSAQEVSTFLPPDILRFLIVRTPIGTALDFNPYQKNTVFNIFDDFDRCMNAYYIMQEGTIPEGKKGEVIADFSRIIELSAVALLPEKRLFLPRFRTIVNLIKEKKDLVSFFTDKKGDELTVREKKLLKERIRFGHIYLRTYAQSSEISPSASSQQSRFVYTSEQKDFLRQVVTVLSSKTTSKETMNTALMNVLKKNNFDPSKVFPALYYVLTGLTYGPRAVDMIMKIGVTTVRKKIKNSLS
ncbi:MAG TPA: lysine--tRNA ligase [Patescibacteria group bacterium]|nr:lysine--tRNA ligase [Patescibacteria group bacterium]